MGVPGVPSAILLHFSVYQQVYRGCTGTGGTVAVQQVVHQKLLVKSIIVHPVHSFHYPRLSVGGGSLLLEARSRAGRAALKMAEKSWAEV